MGRIFAIFLLALVAAPSAGFSQDVPDPDLRRSAGQSSTAPPTSTNGPSEAQPSAQQLRENWRQLMLKRPAPKAGCYSTTFPSTEWQELPCSTETARPHPPALSHLPQTGGAGNDPSALVTGSLTSATGSLHQVTGVTQESDPGGQNSYSLQLNTNNFNSASLCAGQPKCGWQQFIRDNPGNVYIQYWLINHTSPCPAKPSGWQFFAGGSGQASGCFINGNQTSAPTQSLSDLQGMRVIGGTSAAAQSVVYETAGDQIYTAKDNGDLLGIGTQWTQAEFNIFGLCCGNQATFNAGSTIVVQIDVGNGTQTAPTCPNGGFTAESNNLNPVSPCYGFADPNGFFPPAVIFTEDLRQAIPGCGYPNGVTACVTENGSTISDAAYAATCPASSALTMQRISNGQWLSLPQHCSDGSFPGSCNASAIVANQFVLGTQQYGVTYSGAPIGSTQTVHLCDNASRCSQFTLNVSACTPLPSPNDKFYLNVNSSPFQLVAGGATEANLIMDGPWIAPDHGNGAIGMAFDTGGLPSGVVISLSPGESASSSSYGLMNMYVFAPLSATAGQYSFQVQATDPTSNVTQKTTIPVLINACVPRTTCPAPGLCGPVSDSCGGSVECGSCASGVCSNSFCCPSGSFYNTALNTCQPNSCPTGTEYCFELGICTTAAKCDRASNPPCRKVGHVLECQ
jgi:hypothetical protein